MIYLYLACIAALSIYDTWTLKKSGLTKEIWVMLGCMVLAAAFGVIYLSDVFRPSIMSYIFEIIGR